MNIEAGTALVTGASSGIGAAYARQLAARGHDLILSARRQDRLDALAQQLRAAHGCKVEAWPADLANPQDLLRLEEALSTREDIAMLVNCAGLGALGPARRPTRMPSTGWSGERAGADPAVPGGRPPSRGASAASSSISVRSWP